jgi:hypothetical protein
VGASKRIGPALEAALAEPVHWAWGQNTESRYSQTGRPNLLTGLVLRQAARRRSRPDAVRLPRFPVLAVGAGRLYVFEMAALERAAKSGTAVSPIASLSRPEAELDVQRGLMWKRVTIISRAEGRSYTIYLNSVFGGRKRVAETLRALRDGADR